MLCTQTGYSPPWFTVIRALGSQPRLTKHLQHWEGSHSVTHNTLSKPGNFTSEGKGGLDIKTVWEIMNDEVEIENMDFPKEIFYI